MQDKRTLKLSVLANSKFAEVKPTPRRGDRYENERVNRCDVA